MKTNSNLTSEGDTAQYAAFDVQALYEVIRRKKWWMAACGFAGLLLGAGYAAIRPDVFEATATVQVEVENPSVLAIQDVNKEDFRQPEALKTVEQQLCTRNLILRVIQTNKLDQTPGFFKPGLLHRIRGLSLSQSDMIDSLMNGFTVKLRRGTRLIDITVGNTNPRMAQTLARSLIDEYVNQDSEWRVNPSKEAGKSLIEEADRLKRKLESTEQALQDYREKNRAVSLEEKQNIVVERLKDLNLRVAQAQNNTLALESDRAQLDKIGRLPEKLLAIGSIANAQSVLDVQRVLTEKEAAFAVLRQRYGPENPLYAQADRQVQQIRATLDVTILNAADSLRAQYEAAKFAQQMSEKMLLEQEQLALDLNKKATQYDVLSREVESDRALFAAVLKRLKETGVIQNTSQTNLRVVEPPMLPDSPNSRKKLLLVLLGMLGGGALGFGGAIGGYLVKPTIQTPDHGARSLGVPAFGTIPQMPGLKGDASRIPCIREPRSQAAEAFRFLAASRSAALGEGANGCLLFTGAGQGDGNTSCAASYAVALAQSGVRTLLVDADLRNPAIGRLFSIPKETVGLADCLASRSSLDICVARTKVENLFVLVAGAAPADLSGLFSGPALGAIISKAVEDYGQVVIDSAPVTVASETLALARHASAVCIVLRSGRTSIRRASRACELLDLAGHRPLGFILNDVPRRTIL
jgi:capsular exopolysaccharide synthesis family protein